MSKALFNNLGGLRFWSQEEIMLRDQAIDRFVLVVKTALRGVNPAWQFFRTETPVLTPENFIQEEYIGGEDLFEVKGLAGEQQGYLRPETTAGSYAVMDDLLKKSKIRLPLCVWQAGKSFRRETNDGASAAKLRFNEFYQLEFQCCYAQGTKADYREAILAVLGRECSRIAGDMHRIVESDRLPKYAQKTDDIELFDGKNDRYVEISSISDRTDNKNGPVLEIAIGLDRLVTLAIGRCAHIGADGRSFAD